MIDLLNMTNEEVIEWFRNETGNAISNQEFIRRLAEYKQNIKNDFQTEWSQKKLKWLFKKYRQKKLRVKIYRRYTSPVFGLIEDTIEDILSTSFQTDNFFTDFVDVKDMALGDKNYFSEEDIKRHNTPTLPITHPCYGCCHYDGCGYFDFYDTDKTEEENFIEHCVGCCCGDGCECNKASDEGCSNYEIEPILG